MQLTELKKMPVEQLIELGEECGLENASRAKRQDIVFGILKNKAKNGEDIEGCLLYTSPSPRDGLLSRMPSSA